MFGFAKKIIKGAAREVSTDLGKNKDFLEACCAAAALVAAADGDIEESEKRKVVSLAMKNPTLGKLYNSSDIERTADEMFKRATDRSGRQALANELQDVKKLENAQEVADQVYLFALDISEADGEVEPEEKAVLAKIASLLGVDPGKFEF